MVKGLRRVGKLDDTLHKPLHNIRFLFPDGQNLFMRNNRRRFLLDRFASKLKNTASAARPSCYK
jgi:hypothetical protein